ncbi:MAG TPA: insulinase family protein [Pyrinomonadaceae bacterium]|nr:insulinase family protein [Pyrinomonadaceae bacterium]
MITPAAAQRRNEKHKSSFSLRLCAAAGVILLCSALLSAQTPAQQPDREELLNGLRLLFWLKPGSPEVILKLRVNSGAAFDLSGKSGQMALLGDLLFPDPATIDYFTDEMGGKLDVRVTYDSTTITMVGKADQLEHMVEVLRNALLATQFTPELVIKMRDARVKLLKDTTIAPAEVADRAIAARLYGDFPYGRPAAGSPEDMARVDRADVMLNAERFLNSNNATLAIIGGVTKQRAMRTLRQLLGPWRKSEQIIPTTFRQPNPPDTRTLIVNVPGPGVELRLAARGVSRSDTDYPIAMVLARVAQHRWQASTPELSKQPVFVRSNAYVLPGDFVMGATVNDLTVTDSLANAKKVIESLMTTAATPDEIERARNELIGEVMTIQSKPDALADPWLDADTYRLSAPQDQMALIKNVTPADVQRVANRLFNKPVASVVAGETAPLKAALQGRYQYEVLGEIAAPIPSQKPPTKPAKNINPG